MCFVGGACRAYLCLEDCWNRRFYSVLPLFTEEGEDDGDDSSYNMDNNTSIELGEFDLGEVRRERIDDVDRDDEN
jgi:hypothetical protein